MSADEMQQQQQQNQQSSVLAPVALAPPLPIPTTHDADGQRGQRQNTTVTGAGDHRPINPNSSGEPSPSASQRNVLAAEERDVVPTITSPTNTAGSPQIEQRPTNGGRQTSLLSRVVSSVRSHTDANRHPDHDHSHDPHAAGLINPATTTSDTDDSSSETSSVREFQRTMSRKKSNEADGFDFDRIMRSKAEQAQREGKKARRLDVAWKGLSIRGVGADVVFAEDLGSIFNPLTKRNDAKRAAAGKVPSATAESAGASTKTSTNEKPARRATTGGNGNGDDNSTASSDTVAVSGNTESNAASRARTEHKNGPAANGVVHDETTGTTLGKNEKYLVRDFTGVLKSGEMCLVLGRPGAGCTTFMKVISNIRQGYAGVDGEVLYGTMDSKEAEKYSGDIVFVDENETHYPDLTVAQTLKFALHMKTPSDKGRPDGVSRDEYEAEYYQMLMRTFGIEHTADTKVGDSATRGVSGGERKRVTLAEALVTRAPVMCIDQGSRGLDASNALELVKTIRTFVNHTKSTSFMTLYQAGNDLYEQFDKVLVIAAGHCIYYGPRSEAKPYFENMGFVVSPGANLSDYLTAVTVATERVIADGRKGEVPNTPEEFAQAYLDSEVRANAIKEYEEFIADEHTRRARTEEYKESFVIQKNKHVSPKSVFTTTIVTQVAAATRRQYALTWNDKASLGIKYGGLIAQSLILGSLFYMIPDDTNGLFTKAGILFLILLVNALLGLGEVVSSFKGRSILAKHKSLALYRPTALILAQVMVDIPVVAGQVTVFIVPIYFMSQLKQTAGAFFTLWVLTYVTTHALLGQFRLIGYSFPSFDGAGAVSGILLGLNIITMGYLVPAAQFKPWIGWFRWINPLYYALESAFGNEFEGVELPCVTPSLIPYGAGYPTSGTGVTCTVQGSTVGSTLVNGDTYIAAAYGYSVSNKWRNFGLVIVWWFAYLVLTCLAVERLKAAGSAKSYLLFRRPNKRSEEMAAAGHADAEKGGARSDVKDSPNVRADQEMHIEKSETLFAWKNLNYTVPVKGGTRQLLNNIQGFTKPGSLTALMGSSGAGKTTLLDVLALRKEEGKVEGDILVDGRELGPSFQRTCGYVSQMDIHEPTQSIREAFLFSARLRQPKDTPLAEIEAYVESVIDILELSELADACIGVPGAGLSIEQRKRCTIGVELVAKPKLLFLDEPTSGLDGQSAFNILRFLRKLADAGQSMLVTVHQPSSLLFEQFDQLLLLAKGGRVVYNGPLGEHSSTMKSYFASKSMDCPEGANPAEFMIDVVSGSKSKNNDWAQIWMDSEEYKQISKEVDAVNEEARSKPPSFVEDGLYYAAPLSTQMRLVTARQWSAVTRTPAYVLGRIGLVVGSGLITGLSFLQMSNDLNSVKNRLLAVFNAMFVAPGLFNIIQPFFISARTLYQTREAPSKMFGFFPWTFSLVVTEIPWLLMSALLSWTVWYLITFPVGQMTDPQHAGAFFAEIVLYFLWIGGFAQTIAALCPNPESAALLNSVPLGLMASFSGVLVPYGSIPVWWRYWLVYIDPWYYILGAQVFFVNHNVEITCTEEQFSTLVAPDGQTCGAYLSNFLATAAGYVNNPDATGECQYCQYSNGNEYLATVNLSGDVTGWRNVGITAIFVLAFWGFIFAIMAWKSRKQ